MLRPSAYMRETAPELIRLMYTSRLSVLVIGMTLVLVTTSVAFAHSDRVAAGFAIASVFVTTCRIAVARAFERALGVKMGEAQAALWEWRYAAAGLPFALLVGTFAAYALMSTDATAQAMSLAVALAYPAGMIVRVAVRPHVARLLLIAALAPPVVASALVPTSERLVLSVILAAYLSIGFELIRYLHTTIVDRVRLQRELARIALHDDLTGLANRRYLKDHLHDIADCGEEHAVLVIDLDRFKSVNDDYGHDSGDTVLREVARRLEGLAHPSDLVVRLGGDEFAIVRRGFPAKSAQHLASSVVEAVSAPIFVEAGTVCVGASVGISQGEKATLGDDLLGMLSKADTALYDAKSAGRGRFSVAS